MSASHGFVLTVDHRMPPDVLMLVGRRNFVASRELTSEEWERCAAVALDVIASDEPQPERYTPTEGFDRDRCERMRGKPA